MSGEGARTPRSSGEKLVSGKKGPIPAALGFATPVLYCGATGGSTLEVGLDSLSWVRHKSWETGATVPWTRSVYPSVQPRWERVE